MRGGAHVDDGAKALVNPTGQGRNLQPIIDDQHRPIRGAFATKIRLRPTIVGEVKPRGHHGNPAKAFQLAGEGAGRVILQMFRWSRHAVRYNNRRKRIRVARHKHARHLTEGVAGGEDKGATHQNVGHSHKVARPRRRAVGHRDPNGRQQDSRGHGRVCAFTRADERNAVL